MTSALFPPASANNTNGTITGATNASPIAVTTGAPHLLATGQQITITGVLGNTAANGTWAITVTGASTFTLNGSTGNGVYTSGGSYTFVNALLAAATVPSRLLFASLTNNDASPRYLALFNAASLPAMASPTWISPAIAAGATYTCTNGDLGNAGLLMDRGVIAASVTANPNTSAVGNVPTVALGTSAAITLWTQQLAA